MNVFYHLSNELVALEWEADMHNIASGHRCGQIDIYAEGLMLALNNLHQCFADLSETDDNHNLLHGSGGRTTEIADLCPAVAETTAWQGGRRMDGVQKTSEFDRPRTQ